MYKEENLLVAIWMVTYNHNDFIEEAVENIVRQETNFSFKLFIGDDNSTDGTKEKCINLRNKYSEKIELFINEKNIGAINNGLKIHKECILSGAKYIAFCEGDDYWLGKDRLQKQVDFLENNNDYYLTAGNSKKQIENSLYEVEWRYIKKTNFSVINYLNKMFFHTSSICIRNSFQEILETDISELMQIDQLIVLFGARPSCDKIFFFPDFLSVYRLHVGGITNHENHKNINKSINSLIIIYQLFNRKTNYFYSSKVLDRTLRLIILSNFVQAKSASRKLWIFITNPSVFLKHLQLRIRMKSNFH